MRKREKELLAAAREVMAALDIEGLTDDDLAARLERLDAAKAAYDRKPQPDDTPGLGFYA